MKTLLVLASFLLVSWAYAAPAPIITSTIEPQADKKQNFAIGLTSSVAQRPFVGVDNQTTSLIYISTRYKTFYIEGLDAGVNLLQSDNFNLDILATPRYYEVKASFADNGELNGIDETRPTYLLGVSMQTGLGDVNATLQLLHDVIESDGNEAVLQFSKSFKATGDLTLSPSIGATYQDKKLVNHFYGVQVNEVIANRAFYSAKSSVNYNATIHAKWNVSRHIELLGQIRYEALGDGITDSPIVDEDSIYSLTIGVLYRF